jgi:type II secretory pathway component PulF
MVLAALLFLALFLMPAIEPIFDTEPSTSRLPSAFLLASVASLPSNGRCLSPPLSRFLGWRF